MGLLNRIIDFDPIVDRAVDQAFQEAEKLMEAGLARVQAMLPLLAAAAAKALVDQLAEHLDDIPVVGDVTKIAEEVRDQLNNIPDIDIPILSDVFDLTEWIKQYRPSR